MMSTHRHTAGIARCGLAARLRSARAGTAHQCGCLQTLDGKGAEEAGEADTCAHDVSPCRRAARAPRRCRPGTSWTQTARELALREQWHFIDPGLAALLFACLRPARPMLCV